MTSCKEIDSNCYTFTGMDCTYTNVEISSTGYFSTLINDYIKGETKLSPFYVHSPDAAGLSAAIEARKGFQTNRKLLVEGLKAQYNSLKVADKVNDNLSKLEQDNCFTITTAHQPAIFTGTLYFVYKILHVVGLCHKMKEQHPDKEFVPVFYMGSEDADLDELGHIYLSGDTIRWNTNQEGAVGRMKAIGLDPILNRIKGELSVLPFGEELHELLSSCYRKDQNIQQATFQLLNELFGNYGLIVLIPDNPVFKKAMIPLFKNDLFEHKAFQLVSETNKSLETIYKVQANPREINLFYFGEGRRDRIEQVSENEWIILNTEIRFTKESLEKELNDHPENFSPNVILRGLMQEFILPNIAYVGGGGELAYWMEYRSMFEAFNIPFPVLLLRKSLLLMEEKSFHKIQRLGIPVSSIFKSRDEILAEIVRSSSENQLSLVEEIESIAKYYDNINGYAGSIDPTLEKHVEALKVRALKPLHELEKKMLRAEKRKFEEEQQSINKLKTTLFPKNNLQERVENFMPYYAKYGKQFFEEILKVATSPEFGILIIT